MLNFIGSTIQLPNKTKQMFSDLSNESQINSNLFNQPKKQRNAYTNYYDRRFKRI
jgi:hypothetical protein